MFRTTNPAGPAEAPETPAPVAPAGRETADTLAWQRAIVLAHPGWRTPVECLDVRPPVGVTTHEFSPHPSG